MKKHVVWKQFSPCENASFRNNFWPQRSAFFLKNVNKKRNASFVRDFKSERNMPFTNNFNLHKYPSSRKNFNTEKRRLKLVKDFCFCSLFITICWHHTSNFNNICIKQTSVKLRPQRAYRIYMYRTLRSTRFSLLTMQTRTSEDFIWMEGDRPRKTIPNVSNEIKPSMAIHVGVIPEYIFARNNTWLLCNILCKPLSQPKIFSCRGIHQHGRISSLIIVTLPKLFVWINQRSLCIVVGSSPLVTRPSEILEEVTSAWGS